MPAKTLVGLDIGSKFVKALQLTEEGGAFKITGFAMTEIPSADAVSDALKQLFGKGRFKGKRVALGVSGRSVFVRYVPMGVMSDQELVNAARYELGTYIPIEVDEVIHDCQKLEDPQPGANEMKVVLVAARRAYVDNQITLLENSDLYPNLIDVECFALANAYDLANAGAPEGANPNRVVALVDIGASKSNVVMISKGTCQFTREFYKGGDEMTDVLAKKLSMEPKEAETLKRAPGGSADKVQSSIEDAVEDICNDVKISIDFFEGQADSQVEDVFLTGGSSGVPGLKEAMERATQKSVRLWNPLETVPMQLDPEAEQELRAHASQAAIALGLATRFT